MGKALAEKLGYDFYDAEIIQMTAGTTGYTPEFIKKNEEIMTNSLLYDLVNQMYLNTDMQDEAPKDKIFEAESQVVRDLAKKGNCVIVGRCADYVLRNSANCLKVDPCIPHTLSGFTVTRRFRGAVYHITVDNAAGVQHGIKAVTVDGKAISGNVLPLAAAGTEVTVQVTMG